MKTCIVCEEQIPEFVEVPNIDGMDYECPLCRCLTRHRALVKQFNSLWLNNPNVRITDVGTHPSLLKYFWKKIEPVQTASYIPLDIRPWDARVMKIDLARQQLTIAPCDVVICLYVLDQIMDDIKAMENLALATKVGGKFVFDTRFKDGDSDRPTMIPQESERLTRFGRTDALRLYGRSDIQTIVNAQGFTSEWVTIDVDESNGIFSQYKFLVGTKI